jgi:predicted nucleic acid-binding protein
MKKLFVDTNIILDLLGERLPFYESAARLATLADKKKLIMVVSPISFATISYVLSKFEAAETVKEKLRKFKIISEISRVNEATIEKALNSKFGDFEDALQYFSAIESDCNILITRNAKDFKLSAIPVMSAEEYLKSIA